MEFSSVIFLITIYIVEKVKMIKASIENPKLTHALIAVIVEHK